MIDLAQTFETGLVAASIYLMLGVSWNIVYNSSGYLNLTIGEVYVLSAMLSTVWRADAGLRSVGGATALVLLVIAAGSWATERTLLRPLTDRRMAPVIVTVGLALILSELTRRLAPELVIRPPDFFGGPPWSVGGVLIARQDVVVLLTSAFLSIAVTAYFRFTDRGRVVRACSDDRLAAIGLGIDVRRIETMAFVFSSVVVAVSAIVVAPLQGVSAGSGEMIAIKSFLAVSLGGLGRYGRAAAGAIVVGMLEAFVGRYLTTSARDVIVLSVSVVALIVTGTVGTPRRRWLALTDGMRSAR
jgi:branched-chain amino acid transport system permease protein